MSQPKIRQDGILVIVSSPSPMTTIDLANRHSWNLQIGFAACLNVHIIFELPLTLSALLNHPSSWLYLIETTLPTLWNWPVLRRQATSFPFQNVCARGKGFCLRSRDVVEKSTEAVPFPIPCGELFMSGCRDNIPIVDWARHLSLQKVLFYEHHKVILKGCQLHHDLSKQNLDLITTFLSSSESVLEINEDGQWNFLPGVAQLFPKVTLWGLNRCYPSSMAVKFETWCLMQQKKQCYLLYNVETVQETKGWLSPIDVLILDSWKCYGHVLRQLNHFQGRVKKMILVIGPTDVEWHDQTCKEAKEMEQNSIQYDYSLLELTRGTQPAIEEFLRTNLDWKKSLVMDGVTCLERKELIGAS